MAAIAVACLIILIGIGIPGCIIIRILSETGTSSGRAQLGEHPGSASSFGDYDDLLTDEAIQSWMARALSAEADCKRLQIQVSHLRAEIAQLRNAPFIADSESRFAALRRLIAKEFHPDFSSARGQEKIIRTEIFKRIWPKIEQIENH